MYYVPTKEECDLIVNMNDSFIKKEESINGHKVVQYNYMLASYSDFVDPIGDGSIRADELRGITFVEDSVNDWNCNLMLHKFFRISQTIGYMYDDVKNKEILSVHEKEDGSLIGFVKIGDKVYAKSKFSFQSEQAKAAQEIYENDQNIAKCVNWCIDNGYSPIFEYVSPFNQVVVLYPSSKLILLQVRVNCDGRYLNTNDIRNEFNIEVVKSHNNKSLDELLDEMETITHKEGYVIRYNDMFMKIKTKWYDSLHSLVTSNGSCSRIDYLINATLDEVVDDLLSQIPIEFADIRKYVVEVNDNVVHYVNRTVHYIDDVMNENGELARKDFALRYKTDTFFSIMMKLYGKEYTIDTIYNLVSEFIKKNTNGMLNAEEFYKNNICKK